MKTPTWATVIGIIMILFGGCGALNNVQKIQSPSTIDEMSGAFEEMSSEISQEVNKEMNNVDSDLPEENDSDSIEDEQDTSVVSDFSIAKEDSAGLAVFEGMFGKLDTMLVFSDYYKTWIVRLGILGLIASIIYVVSGLLMVMGKPIALNVAYGAIAFSLFSVIFQIIILSLDKESGFVAKTGNFTNYFMVLVNVILIVIVLASDKSYFYEQDIIQE